MATSEESLFCPITLELFTDPVLAQDGHTYERQAIEEWIRQHGTSPITRQPLSLEHLYRNIVVKQLIDSFEQSTREKNYQFTLDIDVRKRESQPFIQTFGKAIYHAQWLPTNGGRPEIILLKIDGTRARKEASFYVDLSRHPHIVRTFGLVYDNENNRNNNNSVMLLQEYAREGNLFHKLQDCKTFINEQVFIEIFLQIIDAMTYLAHNGVVHGDLACRNVLVFRFDECNPKNNIVKLTDFGISRHSRLYSVEPGAAQTRINIVPTRYAAPEILSSHVTSDVYTEKSDIYSMGVLMWEAYSHGEIPWLNISHDDEVIRHVQAGKFLPQPPNCSQQCWSVMLKTWSKNIENRPTFQELGNALKEQYYHEGIRLNIESPASGATVTAKPRELKNLEVEKTQESTQSDWKKKLQNSAKTVASATGINTSTFKTMTSSLSSMAHTLFKEKKIESIPHQNQQLEQQIASFETHSVVELSNQQLVDQDMEIVIREAIINKQCKVLLLKSNKISSKGASILADALRRNTTLEHLYLSHNELSDDGVEVLAKALEINNNNLQHLGLGWNMITNKGAQHLSEMLKKNTRLLDLGLLHNEIGDHGVRLLARAIEKHSTSLEGLCLDENNAVTDASVDLLVDMIKHSQSLKQLWIRGCRLSDKSKKKLRKAAESKQNFQLDCEYDEV